MTWISKNLTLDLLAIGIHAMQKTFDRIKQEPDTQSPWPVSYTHLRAHET